MNEGPPRTDLHGVPGPQKVPPMARLNLCAVGYVLPRGGQDHRVATKRDDIVTHILPVPAPNGAGGAWRHEHQSGISLKRHLGRKVAAALLAREEAGCPACVHPLRCKIQEPCLVLPNPMLCRVYVK